MEALTVPRQVREEIEREIGSEASPVGIDAKKTHVLILHLLVGIERRLAAVERRLAAGDAAPR